MFHAKLGLDFCFFMAGKNCKKGKCILVQYKAIIIIIIHPSPSSSSTFIIITIMMKISSLDVLHAFLSWSEHLLNRPKMYHFQILWFVFYCSFPFIYICFLSSVSKINSQLINPPHSSIDVVKLKVWQKAIKVLGNIWNIRWVQFAYKCIRVSNGNIVESSLKHFKSNPT